MTDKLHEDPAAPKLDAEANRAEAGLTRRELFGIGNVLAMPVLLGGATAHAEAGPLKPGPEIYQSIGVEPIINCRGTFTIIGGSVERPEVRAAMDAASKYFVQIDELAAAVGQRFAELTGAEWGMVSAGCAAGLKHVTAACVTGGNPERLIRIPDLTGFDKTEVVSPRYSRNVYDAAVRNIGVRMVTVDTPEELENALGPRTAMIYLTSGGPASSGPLSLENVASANGEVDGLRYGSALRPRGLVGLRGAGFSYDGIWYVNRVSHKIKRGEYKQNFTLTRNGLVSTVPTVPTVNI